MLARMANGDVPMPTPVPDDDDDEFDDGPREKKSHRPLYIVLAALLGGLMWIA